MPDEPLLRVKAREAVEQRKLPNRHPDRLWRGPGVGAPCAMCDIPLRRTRWKFRRSLRGRVARRTSMCTTSTFAAIRPGS